LTQGFDTDSGGKRLGARLTRWLWAARLVLWWERLWPAAWPAVGVAGLFLAFALFDLLPALPAWLHALILLGLAVGFGYALWRGFRRFAAPDLAAARRRIELDSGFVHRPLTTIADEVAGGASDVAARELWRRHRARIVAGLGRLRLNRPRPRLAERDPWGLRAALGLVLVVAVIAAREDFGERLLRAVSPGLALAGTDRPTTYDIWITPPDYTGLPPVLLSSGGADGTAGGPIVPPGSTVTVAEGSKVLAQMSGPETPPSLAVGERDTRFAAFGDANWRLETKVELGDRLTLTAGGRALAEWSLVVTPDTAPKIALAADPAQTDRGVLHLQYNVSDDYGVVEASAAMRPTEPGIAGQTIEVTLPLPGRAPREAVGSSFNDLTSHPLAGTEVELQLVARDATGQSGRSDPILIVLPERAFHHPVARAIIELRRLLTLRPAERGTVANALKSIAADTASYNDDSVVMLALSAAAARLRYDIGGVSAIPPVQALLWDTAVRIEEGELAVALQRLRDAQQALEKALDENASPEEIQRLMSELQQAMNEYLDALVQKMQRDLAEGRQLEPVDPNAVELQREDLQRMLDQARQMADAGARDAARNLLDRLKEMLENLQAGAVAGDAQEGENEAAELMRQLQDLTRKQQDLLDRTFRDAQSAESGAPVPDMSGQSAEQEGLRQSLGSIMRQFGELTGEIPQQLGNAERAMKDAVGALDRDQPGPAADAEARALDELMQGAEAMTRMLAQRFGGHPGRGGAEQLFGQNPNGANQTQPGAGIIDTGDVKIPEEADLQRARQILDELRRRSSEQFRPKYERDYLRRLLERF
jgi:uncharacterized protein (TIGR02302 family)